jgi:hypothetical protein
MSTDATIGGVSAVIHPSGDRRSGSGYPARDLHPMLVLAVLMMLMSFGRQPI